MAMNGPESLANSTGRAWGKCVVGFKGGNTRATALCAAAGARSNLRILNFGQATDYGALHF